MSFNRRVVTLLLSLAMLSFWAFAQTETGQISGTVTDPTGAVVTGAKVLVVSTATGAARTTTSNSSGEFAVTNLEPTTYMLTVEGSNFQKFVQQIKVTVGSRNQVPVSLAVQSGSATIEVTADSTDVKVETQTQELSQVVSSEQMTELPTLTRNPYALVGTSGNVTEDQGAFAPRGAGFNINGQRSSSTDILLDGGENVNLFTASVGQAVPLDSVQELRVISNNFSAEYGRASGGIVNVATKSGTNAFHGSAYDYNRLSALSSNTSDNNATGVPRGRFVSNQFGYSIGGPVIKNKLFFFNSTEWTRIRSTANVENYILDPALLAATDPATQSYFGTYGQVRSGITVKKTYTASDLVNNQIAGGTGFPIFSALAAANPNMPALDLISYQFQGFNGGGLPQNTYSTVLRLDFNWTDKTTFFGRYARFADNLFPGNINSSPYAGYDTGQMDLNQNYFVNMTHIFSPNLVSQSKVIYNRLNQEQPLGTQPAAPTMFLAGGPPAIQLDNNAQFLVMPGYGALAPGNALPFGGPQNVMQFTQDLSWTKGAHQFRFGGTYLYTQDNRTFGAFEEGAAFVDASGSTQNGFDNLLSGQLQQYSVALNPQGKFPCSKDITGHTVITPDCTLNAPIGAPNFSRSYRYHDGSAYAMDSWRASRSLTLNAGLRWEYYGTQKSSSGNDSNFYLGSGTTFFDRVRNGSVQLASKSPVGSLWAPSKKNFAPRVGFAWDVMGDGKTSVRGGYGIAYERNFGNVTFNVIQNPPFYGVVNEIAGVDLPSITIPTNNYDPFVGASVPLRPVTLRAVDPNIKTAYSQFWNFSVERELLKNTLLSVDYAGSKGTHLYDISNINQVGFGAVYEGDANNGGSTNNRLNYRYSNINWRGSNGFSNYNALNVRVASTNLANTGLGFNAVYTWSHEIDDLSDAFSAQGQNNNLGYLDPFNPSLDKGSGDFDIRHRFVFSGIWDLPFGQHSSGWMKQAISGWELAPIYTAETGVPFTVFDCTNNNGVGVACARYIPSAQFQTSGSTSTTGYLRLPAAVPYADPISGYGQLPTCTGFEGAGCSFPSNMTGRNAFRGPGAYNISLGVYKTFALTERFRLQFRGEAYNLFNHSDYFVQTGGAFNNGGLTDVAQVTQPDGSVLIPGKRGSTPTTPGAAGERRFVQLALRLTF